jgi:DNA modification methylase
VDALIPESLDALRVPIRSVKHYGRNPRKGNVDVIAESLRVNGQYRPVVVNKRTGEVLAGNHTLKAARKLGWSQIAATFVDVDDESAARIVLVDNRSNDLAEYDSQALVDMISSLSSLEGSGFDEESLRALLADVTDLPTPLPEPDHVPDVPAIPVSKPGDIWLLGPHRVACGDSSDVTLADALMADAKADLVWTDPPYGVAYVGSGRAAAEGTQREAIQNDDMSVSMLTDFLRETLGVALQASRPGACWYVAAPPGPAFLAFGTVLTEFGVWRQTLAWVKHHFVIGRSDYHGRHESIFYGSTSGADPHPLPPDDPAGYDERSDALVYGWTPGAAHQPPPDRKQDSVWEFPKPAASKEHPTMKPVALIEKALVNSSNRGDIVLDIFGGSGSTLIACYQQGRVARMVELDPRYVDVICRRYQEASGDKPILESTGEPHDFTG